MVNCEICKEKGANRWINGKCVCFICYLSLKHIHYLPFTRALKKHSLFEKFVERHPEIFNINCFGNKATINKNIMRYLRILD